MKVQTTPWFRAGLTAEEQATLYGLRGEGRLSLFADGPRGPFGGALYRDGCEPIRVLAPTRAGVLERLIAQVAA